MMKRICTILLLVSSLISCNETIEKISPYLFLEEEIKFVSWVEQSIRLDINSNIDYNISTDCEWMSVKTSNEDNCSFMDISIEENTDTIDSRVGNIIIKADDGQLSATLTVTQAPKSIVHFVSKILEVSEDNQDLEIVINSNCSYDIIIPDSVKSWIALKNTRAMARSEIILSIAKNESQFLRQAFVAISDITQGITDTLHIIQDECYLSLRKIMRNNKKISIYYDALNTTHLFDSISYFTDETYPGVSYDSTLRCFRQTGKTITYNTSFETDNGVFPEKRQFKYTIFVIPDSVLATLGVTDLASFRAYAETQYPEGAGLPDESRESSLNKFLSYHILPVYLTWDQLNTSQPELIARRKYLDELDVEDFYETYLPHSIMRISTPYKKESYSNAAQITESEKYGIFINRKGTLKDEDNLIPGIQIHQVEKSGDKLSDLTSVALNGCYYYVNEPLLYYNENTRNALNVRMRIMCSTLSPDFINSGARGRLRVTDKDRYTVGFLPGFCKNVERTSETEFWVRYRDANFGEIYGDQIVIMGDYDITFKLPPVPNNGMYEIRIWNNSLSSNPSACDRGVAQFYYRCKGEDWEPCGAPVDLRLSNTSPLIGWVRLGSLKGEDEIQMNENAMRALGYMRAPDIYADLHKDDTNCHRKILCETYMESDKDYYLRIKKADDGKTVVPFSFIEIVPQSVYSGENGREDRH